MMLGAGHETTANLLSGSLRYLLKRRELDFTRPKVNSLAYDREEYCADSSL
jgi:cytochrome P450